MINYRLLATVNPFRVLLNYDLNYITSAGVRRTRRPPQVEAKAHWRSLSWPSTYFCHLLLQKQKISVVGLDKGTATAGQVQTQQISKRSPVSETQVS